MAGLYIHVPFCHSKCAYCDFYSMPMRAGLSQNAYVQAVVKELEMRREGYGQFRTVYIGGGTPSILSDEQMATLMAAAMANSDAQECTIEVNPEDVTAEKARFWRSLGIYRVSMGVQSLDDEELRVIGRRHTAAQALRAYADLRSGGFGNISLDLIYGLPGQDLESWRRSLRSVLDLQPEHFSAYSLTFEPRTRITSMLQKGEIREVDEDTAVAMYQSLTQMSAEAGYEHYEISNFAKPGMRSRHNSSYWTSTPYLGLGPAAHSFDGKDRYANPYSLKTYLQAIETGMPACEKEEETDADRFNDMVVTALRTAEGLPLSQVPAHRMPQLMRDAAPHIHAQRLLQTPGALIIPESQWLLSDAIMRDLLQD